MPSVQGTPSNGHATYAIATKGGMPILTTPDTFACNNCSKECHKTCTLCQNARYCGKECQTAHWPTHKLTCSGYTKKGKKSVA